MSLLLAHLSRRNADTIFSHLVVDWENANLIEFRVGGVAT